VPDAAGCVDLGAGRAQRESLLDRELSEQGPLFLLSLRRSGRRRKERSAPGFCSVSSSLLRRISQLPPLPRRKARSHALIFGGAGAIGRRRDCWSCAGSAKPRHVVGRMPARGRLRPGFGGRKRGSPLSQPALSNAELLGLGASPLPAGQLFSLPSRQSAVLPWD
jgi:hypothetical protein